MRLLSPVVPIVFLLPGFLAAAPVGMEQRITASDADNSDRFGHSVDIHGDIAVIGAPDDDEEAVNAGAAYVFRRTGSAWVEEAKLTAGVDAAAFDQFGWDVAVERDLIAVGAPNDDEAAGGGSDSGAVYIFEWNGALWQQIAKLLPLDPFNAGYTFGAAVDIGIAVPDEHPPLELTNVAVGAPRADAFEGAVFLYQRSGASWNGIARLADSDQDGPNDNGEFGSALAIRGDALLVGAPLDDQLGSNTGAAYLFGRGQIIDSWVEVAALYPSDPAPGGQFGAAIAVDRLFDLYTYVVGAPAGLSGASPGRIFIGDTAGSPTILTAGGNQDDFGAAVALDGHRLVVGAPGDSEHGNDAGAVYFFFRDAPGSWHADGRVTASDAGGEREFGESVAYHGSFLVGSPQEDAFLPGAAYVYPTLIFSDGFESGDTSAWSAVTP
jgi:hypothetical protein